MFGPRLTTVFASRWKALWWAACVLLTAWCTVPSPPADQAEADRQADAAASAAIRQALDAERQQAENR